MADLGSLYLDGMVARPDVMGLFYASRLSPYLGMVAIQNLLLVTDPTDGSSHRSLADADIVATWVRHELQEYDHVPESTPDVLDAPITRVETIDLGGTLLGLTLADFQLSPRTKVHFEKAVMHIQDPDPKEELWVARIELPHRNEEHSAG